MRLDQLQRHMNERGLANAICYHLGYDNLIWISKDTDMQAEHWNKYSISWEVPDTDYDFDGWALDIAEKLKLEPSYLEFNPLLEPDTKGKFMIYGYQIMPTSSVPSGFIVVFKYTYIDPELALM